MAVRNLLRLKFHKNKKKKEKENKIKFHKNKEEKDDSGKVPSIDFQKADQGQIPGDWCGAVEKAETQLSRGVGKESWFAQEELRKF